MQRQKIKNNEQNNKNRLSVNDPSFSFQCFFSFIVFFWSRIESHLVQPMTEHRDTHTETKKTNLLHLVLALTPPTARRIIGIVPIGRRWLLLETTSANWTVPCRRLMRRMVSRLEMLLVRWPCWLIGRATAAIGIVPSSGPTAVIVVHWATGVDVVVSTGRERLGVAAAAVGRRGGGGGGGGGGTRTRCVAVSVRACRSRW